MLQVGGEGGGGGEADDEDDEEEEEDEDDDEGGEGGEAGTLSLMCLLCTGITDELTFTCVCRAERIVHCSSSSVASRLRAQAGPLSLQLPSSPRMEVLEAPAQLQNQAEYPYSLLHSDPPPPKYSACCNAHRF
jgi:hypothetical protein